MDGMKFDHEKNRWHLLDFEFMDECVRVLTYGAVKYAEDNWKQVERKRYVSALLRHISAYMQGKSTDHETGCSHLAHAFCNLMFLFGHDRSLREKLAVRQTAEHEECDPEDDPSCRGILR